MILNFKFHPNRLSGSRECGWSFVCWSLAYVLSGISQGSILGPLLVIIFINDLIKVCEGNTRMYLFANDAKMYCHITNVADKDELQRGM